MTSGLSLIPFKLIKDPRLATIRSNKIFWVWLLLQHHGGGVATSWQYIVFVHTWAWLLDIQTYQKVILEHKPVNKPISLSQTDHRSFSSDSMAVFPYMDMSLCAVAMVNMTARCLYFWQLWFVCMFASYNCLLKSHRSGGCDTNKTWDNDAITTFTSGLEIVMVLLVNLSDYVVIFFNICLRLRGWTPIQLPWVDCCAHLCRFACFFVCIDVLVGFLTSASPAVSVHTVRLMSQQ